MSALAIDAAPFYPPHVKPCAKPLLRFPFSLVKLLRNNLEAIPEQAYRDPLVIAPGPPRMAFFTGTELVKTLLLARPAEFPKGALQVDVFKPMFGNAMISSEGRDWRWQRGAAAPLFRHQELQQYGSFMSAAADDLLARLLQARDPETGRSMPDELLVDNIVAFLIAGYDTTAFSLTWTLYLISQSPEWEQRMLREIEQVVGTGPVTSAHAERLETVQQVLNESLRLFPTAPVIVRDIVDDIEFDGVSIPAGTIGIIPIYAIHRHRSYWHDPDRFDPARFAPDNRSKPTRFQFMPFGAGPRVCIGAAFAMLEATIMLATFIRAARFELCPGFDPQPSARMFLLPKNGMPMRVTLRERAGRSAGTTIAASAPG
jgi:cytochrome P450